MHPDQLGALEAIVDAGTFEAAARRLGVSTSAVSQRIRALESALGRVLVRRGSPSAPTPDGEVVLRYARQQALLAAEMAAELDLDAPAGVRPAEAAEASGRRDGVVDAVLMDLGVSSLQLDRAERGFSYARSAPLDMRMDQSGGRTAQDLLDTAEERELTRILRAYGEERFASRIAAGIVRRRETGDPVRSTDALADLVRDCVPAAARRTGGHPAKRTFQALRVAVNTELELLERAVPRALNSVRVGGRVVIESYQSLEDRIVKRAFAAGASPSAPQGLPVVPQDALPYIELATRGAVRADDDEVAANPRSASVRLRAATRIRPAAEAPAPEPAPRPRPHPARTPAQGRRGR